MGVCNHNFPQETRSTPDRFLPADTVITLEETLELPLHLSRMPHEINSLSPTPLDPHSLKINGRSYEGLGLDYMDDQLRAATAGLSTDHGSKIMRASHEIEYQHTHRMKKNHEAMQRWREQAATSPHEQRLTHAEAEGVMQVRAGVSKIGAILLLLARNPDIGAVEISKATRPFCTTAHTMAKLVLIGELNQLAASEQQDIETDANAVPYRSTIDAHHGAFITKSLLGTVDAGGVELEIVGRESGLLCKPGESSPIPELQTKNFGPHEIGIVPIDMTSYARVKAS